MTALAYLNIFLVMMTVGVVKSKIAKTETGAMWSGLLIIILLACVFVQSIGVIWNPQG